MFKMFKNQKEVDGTMEFADRSIELSQKLKKVALIFLPALATLWLTLGKIWGLPYTTEIGATITAVAVFLGACLEVSSKNYWTEE